jgi:uncharacterized protein (DUF58 family)
VRLLDPLDMALPDIGLLAFEDSETGEQVFVDTTDKTFRRRFATIAAQSEAAQLEAFGNAGMDVLELSTGDDLVDAILRFAQLRRVQARLGGGGLPAAIANAGAGA